jgi:membrane-bound serine protease (ClpP class)
MLVFGAVLLLVGALLVLVEAHVPTGGVIGGGAVIALVVGAAMMLSAAGAPGLLVLVLALVALGAGVYAVLLLGRSLIRYRRLRPRTGAEALVGHVGVLRRRADPDCRVFVDGALWRAELDWQRHELPAPELHAGDRVVVERVHGLTLCVRKAEEWELVR